MKRLIINADDLGYDPAVDVGLLRALRTGVVTSATLMVNTPYSAEAAAAARGLAVGLHLNLARGRPLSTGVPPSQLLQGGFVEARASALPVQAVEAETRAQLALAEKLLGQRPTHLDVHKHLHRHANVLSAVAAVAQEESLPVRALDAAMREELRAHGVATTDFFLGEAGGEAYWTLQRFLSALQALQEGTTEWMCHPGEPPSAVVSGYALQRRVELQTLTSPEARAALEGAGVVLCDFGTLFGPTSEKAPQAGSSTR
jgi:chitin disaccharide deacetylase